MRNYEERDNYNYRNSRQDYGRSRPYQDRYSQDRYNQDQDYYGQSSGYSQYDRPYERSRDESRQYYSDRSQYQGSPYEDDYNDQRENQFGEYQRRSYRQNRDNPMSMRQRYSDDQNRYDQRGSQSNRNQQSFRGVGPKDYTRSDDRIKEDVCDRLSDDETIDAENITVEVKQGEVHLKGNVSDRNIKRSAEDCCESVSGVKDVINELRVKSNNVHSISNRDSDNKQESNSKTEQKKRQSN